MPYTLILLLGISGMHGVQAVKFEAKDPDHCARIEAEFKAQTPRSSNVRHFATYCLKTSTK